MKWTYLLIDLGSIAIPLLLSFESKVRFFDKWKHLFPAIFIVGALFIFWDVQFERLGVWSFNETYLLGIELFGLPLEEILFFFCIPFACLFIYEVLRYFKPHSTLDRYAKPAMLSIAVLSAALGAIYMDRWYSGTTYILCAVVFYLVAIKNPPWLGLFLRSFLIVLIPFFIVNGLLTAFPVVEYNNMENIGLRLGSIPIEDVSYGLLLLLSVTFLYERFSAKKYS